MSFNRRTQRWISLGTQDHLVHPGLPDRVPTNPPPTPEFTPIALLAMTPPNRPSRGLGVVWWEDIYQSADANNFQATANRVPLDVNGNKQILSLPEGDFLFNSWNNGTGANNGVGIGTNGAGGIKGIVGSGRNTRFGPITNATQSASPPAAGRTDFVGAQMMRISGVPNFLLSNFGYFRNSQVQPYNGGIMLDTCHGADVTWMYSRGTAPGFGNTPPGETFSLNIYKSNDVTIDYSEFDGRNAAGTRVCSTPIGWNGSGSYGTHGASINYAMRGKVYRTYTHHGLCGMGITFWKSADVYTEDFWTYSTMTGDNGNYTGVGINHEQTKGPSYHLRPRLYMHGRTTTIPAGIPGAGGTEAVTNADNGCWHFGLRSTIEDLGATFTMVDPLFDPTWTSSTGSLMYIGSDGYGSNWAVGSPDYTNGDRSALSAVPSVTYNGVKLSQLNHPTSGWNNGNPLTQMACIH